MSYKCFAKASHPKMIIWKVQYDVQPESGKEA